MAELNITSDVTVRPEWVSNARSLPNTPQQDSSTLIGGCDNTMIEIVNI